MFCCVQPEDASGQLDYRYDEFGFKVEEEGCNYCFCLSLYRLVTSVEHLFLNCYHMKCDVA